MKWLVSKKSMNIIIIHQSAVQDTDVNVTIKNKKWKSNMKNTEILKTEITARIQPENANQLQLPSVQSITLLMSTKRRFAMNVLELISLKYVTSILIGS